MFHILESVLSLDPATADIVWTATVSTLLVLAGAVSIWMLPWSDEEINEVDQSFKKIVKQVTMQRPEHRSRLVGIRR